ncbi:hypothetical protein EMCRGX_G015270 [Ephydatia muelleri]
MQTGVGRDIANLLLVSFVPDSPRLMPAGKNCVTRVLTALLSYLVVTKGQDAIQLASGPYGPHMGRLEVLHNGTWGTICSQQFYKPSADIACRRLGYPRGAVCLVPWATFGPGDGPIWMNLVNCIGTEMTLSNCTFPGWGVVGGCTHEDDVGVICFDEHLLQAPSAKLLHSTTNTISIQITTPDLPNGTTDASFKVSFAASGSVTTTSVIVPGVLTPHSPVNYTLVGLTRGTAYSLYVQAQIQYGSYCSAYLSSASSGTFNASTQIKLPPSSLQIRLASADSKLTNIGRLEVLHNNQWGTVCDNTFTYREANVVCNMLNFSQGSLCSVSNAAFGAGIDPVWLGNVRCSDKAEILDQCTRSDWGASGCDHSHDVGVVCIPDDVFFNLTISNTTATSISLKWTPYPSSSYITSVQYWIQYSQSPHLVPTTVSTFQTSYTLTGLTFGTSTSISIKADIQYSRCSNKYPGSYQAPVFVTTKEDAPNSPPANFRVLVLNSTAAQVTWSPPTTTQLNGRLRGYRLFYRPEGTPQDAMVTIDGGGAQSYIAGDLSPATAYVFSVLAFTLGDGPRSTPVVVVTRETDYVPYIVTFGVYGDGLDNAVRSPQDAGIRVLCGVGLLNATPLWYNSVGVVMGGGNGRRVSQSRLRNGTAVLEFVPDGFLTLCDAGTYSCRASGGGGVGRDERMFSLTIGTTHPAPLRPEPIQTQSRFVVVRWEPPPCNGGHRIIGYTLRYKEVTNGSADYRYVFNINHTTLKYTMDQLNPSTSYLVSIQSTDANFVGSPFSRENTVVTLPPAPSPPLNLNATLTLSNTVELCWEPPIVSNGNIVYYTLYGMPLALYEAMKSATPPSNLSTVVKKVFPATATVGMVTVDTFNVVYQFQMTASVFVGTTENEGQPSDITKSTTVFVPKPELPMVQALKLVNASNTTVSLTWSPPNTSVPVLYYLINVTGQVLGYASSKDAIAFQDVRQFSSNLLMVSIAPLVPSTTYTFSVCAVFDVGAGAEVGAVSTLTGVTAEPVGERLVYFQVRLEPIYDCVRWSSENTTQKLSEITASLLRTLNLLCGCGLTPAHLPGNRELSCRASLQDRVVGGAVGGASEGIVYRASLVGTDARSAAELVQLLRGWVEGGTAAIAVGGLLLGVDPNCSVVLGGPSDPGCMARSGGTEGVVTATAAPPLTVSGFVALSLGGAIVLLLIVFVVIVLVLVYWRWRRRPISTIELNSKQLAVKTESGRSLLKDGRRSTESPEEGTHMSMLESHFTTTPHIILEEGTSHGTPLEDHDGVRIVCEDTKGTVPLEDCRSTTSSDVRRSGIHLEDTVPLKDRRATSHTGSTGGLVVLENPRVASLRSMGASPRDSGVDVGSNNDIKGAGTS